MKKSRLYLPIFTMIAGLLIIACNKTTDFNTPAPGDQSKPGVVTNIKVANFNGGAYITYDLPKSDQILYVKANYVINDKTGASLETKSSYYSDTLTVNGFAEKKEYTVALRVVTRANVESDPVEVKVNPDTPVYKVVAKTLSLSPDFQGIRIAGNNPLQKNVGVVLVYDDPYFGKYTIRQQQFNNFKDIDFTSRGFDTLPKRVGVYATDQWGNQSDTLFKTIAPLYEVALDKSKFFVYNLPSDGVIGFGWNTPNLWNGNTQGTGWHTTQTPSEYVLPVTVSFGLGVSAKLSRFLLWQRNGYLWQHGNPKSFTLWGSNEERPADFKPPYQSNEGDRIGDWVNMANYRYPNPPSGTPPPGFTAEDQAWALAGTPFTVPPAAPKVRFLRIVVTENWAGDNNFAHIMELTFYGDPR
ncbi:DUF5000 domain-containing lipoprotein [Niabella hirudinis]|uniref:DUF5000 domain-containing lipoprotein n=1 Tax=Niabella hirudinis TaxID=1285929 RepID=UPI003EC10679